MLKCKICGYYLDSTEEEYCNGICPSCGEKNLGEITIICPECHCNLKDGSRVEVGRMGWCCESCKIKVYKDI